MGLVFVNQIAKNITSSGFVKVLAAMSIFFSFPKRSFLRKTTGVSPIFNSFCFFTPVLASSFVIPLNEHEIHTQLCLFVLNKVKWDDE